MKSKKMRIPRFLYDDESGELYEVHVERHRDGFNLVTNLLEYDDYEDD